MYKTRQEKRQISETMDAIIYPLIQFMALEHQECIRRALEILHETPIEEDMRKNT